MLEIQRFFHQLRNRLLKWWKRTKKNFLKLLKRILRAVYGLYCKMGRTAFIFAASACVVVLVGVVLIITIPASKKRAAAAEAAILAAMATPEPTPTPTVDIAAEVVEETPSPEEAWIQAGQEGEDVLMVQTRLMELGYLDIDEPTSHFGNATQYALKLFQRQHDLQMDGIAGEQTQSILFSEDAQKYIMKEGTEGDDIRSFQEQLEELGYLTIHQITGYYGTDTVNAVKKFQNRNHLTKDGKAGEKTMEAVNSPDARVSYTKEQEVVKAKKKAAAAAKSSSSSGRIDKLISIASKQIGKTYVLGKNGPDSYDCSGLVYYCLKQVGVYTRRLSAAGLAKTTSWQKISSFGSMKKGDLIFFKSDDSSTIGHVAIYIGGGTMIDASSANGKVMKRSCTGSWSRRNFVYARRPIG